YFSLHVVLSIWLSLMDMVTVSSSFQISREEHSLPALHSTEWPSSCPPLTFSASTIPMEPAEPAKVLDRYWGWIRIWSFLTKAFPYTKGRLRPGGARLPANGWNH